MPILYFLISIIGKRDKKTIFDVFAVCAVVTVLFARCNCLISGCCLGRFISEHSELRWPTREIEVIYYVLFLIYYIPRVYKQKTHGEVYPFYMFSYGVVRFILEFFRVSETNNLFHIAHAWSVVSVIIGYSIYASIREKEARKVKGRE